MQINEMRDKAYAMSCSKGFHENPEHENLGEKLMLITSELGEALEADRNSRKADLNGFYERYKLLNESNNGELTVEQDQINFVKAFKGFVKDSYEDEIADVFIRLGDLTGWQEIDIQEFIKLKMRYNSYREHKHGKAY